MSYNQGYGQNSNQGYGQYNPYGQQNPYDQRNDNQSAGRYNNDQGYAQGNPYAQQDNYAQQRPAYQQQSSSQYNDNRTQGNNYEMDTVGNRVNDPNRILNDIRALDREISTIESSDLPRLDQLRNQFLTAVNNDPNALRQISDMHDEIMGQYKAIVARVKAIKQNPESGNPRNSPQVGKIDRRLRGALEDLAKRDAQFRDQCKDQNARQYKIANPNASDVEIREFLESSDSPQIFSQALMNSNRRGEAQATYTKVEDRHKAIQDIARKTEEIAALMTEFEAAVVQQEDQVIAIEDKAADAEQNVTHATVELDGAVKKAKAARRKKWICLAIVILIIIIVIGVAVGVVKANQAKNNP